MQIDASTNTNQVSAASLDATAGTLNVDEYLNVATSLTEGTAVLQGTTGTISLASGSLLSYDSSVSSEFDGQINGAGGLSVYAGPNATLTLGGSNGYSGPTAIGGGTLKIANTAIPTDTALSMTGTALLDLNGYDVYVSVLTGGSGDVIANNATTGSLSNLHVGTGSEWTTSTFAGTIADSTNGGPSAVQLRLEDYTMYFTGTANNDQYGIQLDSADFYVGDGTTNGVVTCNIGAIDESTVYFDVAGQSSTFTGGLGGEMYVEKLAAGTLDFAPAYTSSYFGFDAQQGTVTFLTANATAPGSALTVEGGSTLNLGNVASLPAVQDVNLIDGVITNGQLSFTGSLYLYYGRIDASLNFTGTTAQSVYKWQSTGTVTTITGVGPNTVVLAGSRTQAD